MSSPNDPPLSRRAARMAELAAQGESTTQSDAEGSALPAPVSAPPPAPVEVSYGTQMRPRIPRSDPAMGLTSAPVPPVDDVGSSAHERRLDEPPVAPRAVDAPVRRRDLRPPAEQFAPLGDGVPLTELPQPAPEPILSRRELRARREQGQEQASAAPLTGVPLVEPEPPAPRVLDPEPFVDPAPVAAREAVAAPEPVVESLVEPELPGVPAAVPAPALPPTSDVQPIPALSSTGSHWSVGMNAEDDPFENSVSRDVGASSSMTSTNALVLPEMPSGSIAGPVTGTGEIIITGMIGLPHAVSATGTVPTVHESPDVDDLVDAADRADTELTATPADAAPVSASRAVSSHTQAQAIVPPRTSGLSSNTVTTVLVASTVVMAVVAIGLFVMAAVNGLF